MRLKLFICLILASVTLLVYWPTRHFDLVFYDDPFFIMSPEVDTGLNWHGFEWAFTGIVRSNWHPITNFSFLLMHQFFGYNPGAEHTLNVFFHAANVVLLFLVLHQLSGAMWRSAAVAALFGWHPLRAESVAWIAERKDVLFVFFMLLSLLCYAMYVKPQRKDSATGRFYLNPYYWSAMLFFIFSLLSKAMAVTLPFLLLLLDFWPLGRFQPAELPPCHDPTWDSRLEDSPSPLLSPAVSTRVWRGMFDQIPRLILEKVPFFALATLSSVLTFCVQKNHSAVVKLDHLGIVPRFQNAILSYIHYLGHFFWPARLTVAYQYPTHFDTVEVLLAALLLFAVSALCVLEISRRPYLAVGWFWYLGMMVPVIGLVQVGMDAMADRYTYITLVGPTISLVWLVSELARTKLSRYLVGTLFLLILGACAVSARRQVMFWRNSVTLFDRDIALSGSNYLYPHYPLALGLEEQGRWREAAAEFQITLLMTPPAIRFLANEHYAIVMERLGQERRANQYLEEALQIEPDSPTVLNGLAWLLATSPDKCIRDGKRAVQLAEHACQMTDYTETLYIGTLAAAYAEAGRFDDAAATAQKAIASAQKKGETDLVGNNQKLLQLYREHKVYHEAAGK